MSKLYTLGELHQIVSQLAMITIGDDEPLYECVELNKILHDVFEIKAIRARDLSIADTAMFHLVPIEKEQEGQN